MRLWIQTRESYWERTAMRMYEYHSFDWKDWGFGKKGYIS